jgi:hypothetical protein
MRRRSNGLSSRRTGRRGAAVRLGFLAAAVALPGAAVAQGTPPSLASGPYTLTLTVEHRSDPVRRTPLRSPPNASTASATPAARMALRLILARSGQSITLSEARTVVLRGTENRGEMVLEGRAKRARMELHLADRATGADGSFMAWSAQGDTVRGATQLVPGPLVAPRTAPNRDGCHGFWDCLKYITGYDWDIWP